jgi:hypothetical protein
MSINEDLWAAALPNGEVRSGTLEELNEAVRAGHIGVNTLVRAAHSETWVRLVDVLGGGAIAAAPVAAPRASVPAPPVASQPPPSTNGSPDLWQVRLANGDVRSGTRQQLEEALGAGHLGADVMVLPAGGREWVPLGIVMARSEPPAPLDPVAHRPPSIAPVAAPPPPQPSAPPPRPTDDGLWQVRLADGQVRSGTRQQLEEALNAGHLDEAALVLAAGASEWVTLASIADDRRQPEPAPAPTAAQEPEPVAAPEPAPVEAHPTASVAVQETAATTTEQAPVEPAGDSPAPQPTDDGQPALPFGWDRDQVWRVNLTSRQLEQAFHAGLLEHDALVLAVGTDEWVRLGDVRRAPGGGASTTNGGE